MHVNLKLNSQSLIYLFHNTVWEITRSQRDVYEYERKPDYAPVTSPI